MSVVHCALVLASAGGVLGDWFGALGDEPIRTIDWATDARAGKVGEKSEEGPLGTLVVQGSTVAGAVVVAVIDAPPVAGETWHLAGRVRYRGVAAGAYLNLDNVLPGGTYFTRSLASTGPLMHLGGDSDWRDFSLPFNATGGGRPLRLELSVVLPGPGQVELGRVELFDGFERSTPFEGLWLALGPSLGVLGALFGILAGRRRTAPFAVAVSVLIQVGGLALIVLGIIAYTSGDSLRAMLGVGLGQTVMISIHLLRRQVQKRLRDEELRAMRAADL